MPSRLRPPLPPRLDSAFAVGAVVLTVLLPLTATTVPARDVTWSALDPNLLYPRSPPGTVEVTATELSLVAQSAANDSLVNVASMSSGTIVDLNGTLSRPASSRLVFSVLFTSPYDRSSCLLSLDAPDGRMTVESTSASGAVESIASPGAFDPLSQFDVRATFVPGRPFTYRVAQGALDDTYVCTNAPLAATVPVNLDLRLSSASGASVGISRLQLTLPAASNRQFAALNGLLLTQYAAIGVLAVAGFRAHLVRFVRGSVASARGLRDASARFVRDHPGLVLATLVSVPIQAVVAFLGSHPYDMFTQQLWSYLFPRVGATQLLPVSLLVPGGKPTALVSPIGSFYPYPPVALYFFGTVGYLGDLFTPAAGSTSPVLGVLVKAVWLVFLDATAWVVYLELERKGLDRRTRLQVFLLVALNPGLLIDTMVWGQFEIVVAFFLLASFVAYGRDRPGYAFLFLLVAILTKQTALFAAVFLVPIYLAALGPRRALVAFGKALVGAFFVLLPLLLAGLSPLYVARVTVGDIALNSITPSAVAVAPWQQTVSTGALNLWPLVTGILNGQSGPGRLDYPDYLPGQAFGLPYVLVGAIVALLGIAALLVATAYARQAGRLSYGSSLLVVIAGFLWIFTVTTRMGEYRAARARAARCEHGPARGFPARAARGDSAPDPGLPGGVPVLLRPRLLRPVRHHRVPSPGARVGPRRRGRLRGRARAAPVGRASVRAASVRPAAP